VAFIILIFVTVGCTTSLPTLPTFGLGEKEFSLTSIDEQLQGQLPRSKKTSFGTLKLLGVALQPGAEDKDLEVLAKFVLVSYEIPEGIEGVVGYKAALRYNPKTRALQLGDLQATKLNFGNPSLEEYVSSAARRGIPREVAALLREMTLQRMPEGFRANRVGAFRVRNDKLFVDFD